MKPFLWIVLVISLLVACGGSDSSSDKTDTQSEQSATEIVAQTDATASTTEDLAARVNGTPITMETFERELAATSVTNAASREALRETVLSTLIDQVLIEQYATANNIAIDDAALQSEMNSLNTLATASGFTLAEVLGLPANTELAILEQKVYDGLLSQAVANDVVANATIVTTQVYARHILVRDEALADEILERLQNGEDFATLAATYSIDSATAPIGGDLGWIAPGDLLLDVVEQIIFSLPPATRYPDPVPSDLGWHVIEVLEKDETQSLTNEQLSQQRIQIYQTWLADQRRMATVERFIS